MPATPIFLPTARGQRFCLLHHPGNLPVDPVASILYVHPFAEELNRSRRMVALQCRALAEAGFEVLQLDLEGCGDSAGPFADATWEGWVADVLAAHDWLVARRHQQANTPKAASPVEPGAMGDIWLWGLRAGCLLAAEVARQLPRHIAKASLGHPIQPAKLLFWQPVSQGAVHLAQFLRLKVATDLVRGGSAGADRAPPMDDRLAKAAPKPRHLLAAGQNVEIGGYEVSPALATGLEAAHLEGLPIGSQLVCMEFAQTAADAPSGESAAASAKATQTPALVSQIDRWQRHGVAVQSQTVPGAPFWQTQEIEVVKPAIQLTVQAVLAAQKVPNSPGASSAQKP